MTNPFADALSDPVNSSGSMTFGMSAQRRMDLAMRLADPNDPTKTPEPSNYSNFRVGVPNPYGRGIRAYEPNNVIFQAYAAAKNDSDTVTATEAASQAQTVHIAGAGDPGALLGNSDGGVARAIQAAMGLAQRGVPYTWGGTTANGVDCSGLLTFAFRQIDPKFPRYRAQDFAHLGQTVNSVADARPGDVIYYDNPNTSTDHVGLYIGGGLMIQAPQTGDHVRVTSIGRPTRIARIFDDSSFAPIQTPTGGFEWGYNGQAFRPYYNAPVSPLSNPSQVGSTVGPVVNNIGRNRAI